VGAAGRDGRSGQYAAFATTSITGQFTLRSNDGYSAVLADFMLHPVQNAATLPGDPGV